MRRRAVAWVLVCLCVWFASAAGAQTTTTTSSTTATSTSTSSVPSTTSTTSTTMANPCDTQVCTDRPPSASLSGASGEVVLDRGSSCWRSPRPDAEGSFVGICLDRLAFEPDAVLVVRQGETLTLRFSAMTPTEVHLQRGDQSTPLTAGNPVRFTADLPAGSSHVVGFFTRWLQGDASYYVRLNVRAAGAPPATPRTAANLALTG